jgi:membrane protein
MDQVFQGLFAGKILLAVLNTVAFPSHLHANSWRDLVLGAFVTAVLFTIGKSLIGNYRDRAAPSFPDSATAR